MYYIIVFIFGSIWGSFSNVCIHRIPDNISVIKGRSHCPACKRQIRWYDNIPLISFLVLKAQCRDCSAKINLKYFKARNISIIEDNKKNLTTPPVIQKKNYTQSAKPNYRLGRMF